MKAPGPSALQFLWGVRTQGFLDLVGSLWRQHGDVFQVGLGSRRLLFAMHPDAVKYVNVTRRQNFEKLKSYQPVRDFLTGEGLVSSTGALWLRQRRLMAPFFTTSGVQAYAELFLRDGAALAERWETLAREGAPVDMAEEMTRVTAAIILRAMFSSETLESIHQMKEAVEAMITFVNDRLTGLELPLWMPTPANRRYLAARRIVHGTIERIIADRRTLDEASWPEDLLSRLMRARDPETGEAMSEVLLRDESITTFFAGHETTARTLTFTWYALAANPEVAARLHAELDEVLGGRPPTAQDLRRLPYTLQVVKETLRMYPAAPFYVRDAAGPDELGGFEVEAGTGVMLSPYFTHRHPAFWEDPERFDPERWTEARERARHPHAYHPFAAGPRVCIGNNFSLLESHLLLAVLAQRFAPRLTEGYTARWEMQGVLGLVGGLPMVVAAR